MHGVKHRRHRVGRRIVRHRLISAIRVRNGMRGGIRKIARDALARKRQRLANLPADGDNRRRPLGQHFARGGRIGFHAGLRYRKQPHLARDPILHAEHIQRARQIGSRTAENHGRIAVILAHQRVADQRGRVGRIVDAFDTILRNGFEHRRFGRGLSIGQSDRQPMHEHGRYAGSGAGVEQPHGIAELRGPQIAAADRDRRDARLIFAIESVQHSQSQHIVDAAHGRIEYDSHGRFGCGRKLHVR